MLETHKTQKINNNHNNLNQNKIECENESGRKFSEGAAEENAGK